MPLSRKPTPKVKPKVTALPPIVSLKPKNEILERVPLILRKEYAAAWDRYASSCRMGGTKEERAFAYKQARVQEDKLTMALEVATAEQRHEDIRNSKAQRDES